MRSILIRFGIPMLVAVSLLAYFGVPYANRLLTDWFRSDVNLRARKVLFGVGIVENAYDETALIEIIPAERLATREPDLQAMAKRMMPQRRQIENG